MNEDNILKSQKRSKRKQLLEQGIQIYPHNYKKTHYSQDLLKEYANKKMEENSVSVSLAGRIMRKRDMGKAAFFNIQDGQGEIQCYLKQSLFNDKESWEIWKLTDIGDIVGVIGNLFRTKKGELSIRLTHLKMLCKTLEILPEKYHGLEDKELKYRYRHLDLIMNPQSREVFITRSKIISVCREYMNSKHFIEVETPVLQPIYGGANAFPFSTHHRRLDRKLFLKISPELYLKRLIVGGLEKVYEIGKNFRNEGIDRSHNPEFTMMEYYEAYTDYEDQMKQFEDLICFVVKKIKGTLKITYQSKALDFSPPWQRISVQEAIQKHGNISVEKLNSQELLKKIIDLDPAFEKKSKNKTKGEIIMRLFELTAEKHFWNPVFIIDFPLEVSPLTKKHRSLTNIVERFEPMIAGMELGNAYTELNDPVEQKERLKKQEQTRKTDETAHPMDENFIHAMEVGMAPTGGVGLGIERLVMILTDQASIKDVILFPILKTK